MATKDAHKGPRTAPHPPASLRTSACRAAILGLQNNIRSSLADALKYVPEEDGHAEITRRQKESDGQILIWLAGRQYPSYSIQE